MSSLPVRNLLFLFTDEQRFDTLPTPGRPPAMPTLAALAGQSTVATEAYCTQPVCTPSRASIMTGLYPFATGATQNNYPLRPEVRCLPEYLPDDTTETAYFGKWHLGDEIFPQHGFERWEAIEDNYHAHYAEGRDPDARSAYHHFLRAHGFKPDQPDNRFSRDRTAVLPEPFTKARFLGQRVADFLHTRDRDRPFVAYANFLEPHMPFFGPHTKAFRDRDDLLPPGFRRKLTAADPLGHRLKAAKWERDGFEWYDLAGEAGWRELAAAYYGLCHLVDAALADILAALHASGHAEDTLVVFTSDHGEMLGARRMIGKGVMDQDSVRVPLLFHLPGQTEPRRLEGPFSLVDLVPTLLDLLGHEVPDGLHGCSRAELVRQGGQLEEDAFVLWMLEGKDPMADGSGEVPAWMRAIEPDPQRIAAAYGEDRRTIITPDGWRYTHSSELGEHQLFHLREDPFETRNLVDAPDQQGRIRDLRQRLAAWQERTGDPGTQVTE